jgi:hypothetical protein
MDRRIEQSPDLRLIEGAGQRDRRKPRAVQALVGVGVADPGEKPRVRQRALQGVILFPDAGGEFRVIAGENFQSSWVHGLQRRLPFDDVQ